NEQFIDNAAVLAVLHDAFKVVDRVGILHRLARADELRHASGIESAETADGRLGDHYARGVDPEIVARMNQAGHAIHDDAISLGGHDLEDDVPTLAGRIARPVVV